MPPEFIKEGKISPKNDVFSLGVVMRDNDRTYWLLQFSGNGRCGTINAGGNKNIFSSALEFL
jgi:hypothetical protein